MASQFQHKSQHIQKTSWNLKSCYNFSDNCELYETIIKIWYLQFNIHVI